jgi:hypothetical protein
VGLLFLAKKQFEEIKEAGRQALARGWEELRGGGGSSGPGRPDQTCWEAKNIRSARSRRISHRVVHGIPLLQENCTMDELAFFKRA